MSDSKKEVDIGDTHRLPSRVVARKYLQYHFDGEGKLKLMKNENKEC